MRSLSRWPREILYRCCIGHSRRKEISSPICSRYGVITHVVAASFLHTGTGSSALRFCRSASPVSFRSVRFDSGRTESVFGVRVAE